MAVLHGGTVKHMRKYGTHVTIRISDGDASRLVELAGRMPPLAKLTIAREAMLLGLAALEARLGAPAPVEEESK